MRGEKFYTYHDFAMESPDFTYAVVGFNLVYKANPKIVNDSVVNLHFIDCHGDSFCCSHKLKNTDSLPDNYLIFRNINPKCDEGWIICAPEVNTPENRAKISDYGYVFDYNIFNKDSIETQCLRI